MKSSPIFCSLEDLIDWIHDDSILPKCAYLVKGDSQCKSWMSVSNFNDAQAVIAKHLDILTGFSSELTVVRTRSQVFRKLTEKVLCGSHKKHHSQAAVQWRHELRSARISIITKLVKYYNYGVDDSSTEDSAEDTDENDHSGCYSDSEAGEWVEEQSGSEGEDASEEDASEEDFVSATEGEVENASEEDDRVEERISPEKEEGISNLSCQPSSPARVRRHKPIIPDEEVAKQVTFLLKKPATGRSEKVGWIYVIHPSKLPGMFKVGYTAKPPEHRFTKHRRCHPEFEVITTELIPYAYRVEQLIFTEFTNNHWELENGCPKCDGKFHRELLDIDEKTLLQSLEKWIKFVKSNPYSKSGNFKMKEAKTGLPPLPPPASQSYLNCKRSCLWTPPRSSAKKKPESQNFQDTPLPGPNFKPSTLTAEGPGVDGEVEIDSDLDSDDLPSRIKGLQVTPSKPNREVK